jgi:hypothetical protein
MINELALLLTLASPVRGPSGPEVAPAGPVVSPVAKAPVTTGSAGTVCDIDCVWAIYQHNWVCVTGTAGYDCREYSNGCGFMNCGNSFIVDAGGALRQVAMCDQSIKAAQAKAVETGTLAELNDAFRSGLITQKNGSRVASLGTSVVSQQE